MQLPKLLPDRLYVFVFGPGTGECILVRAPPDAWLIVDGCATGRTFYGLEVLRHYGADDSNRVAGEWRKR